MKKATTIVAGILALMALMATSSFAQGWGRGFGPGPGMGGGPGAGVGPGGGPGGPGLLPLAQTDEEKAFVEKATELHQKLRTKRWELLNLERDNADEAKIAEGQKQLNQLREKLYKLNGENRKLRWQMMDRARKQMAERIAERGGPGMGRGRMNRGGGPAGMGPRGGRGFGMRGMGPGAGMGRGVGMGRGAGVGFGMRGMGLGAGMGFGPCCPWGPPTAPDAVGAK